MVIGVVIGRTAPLRVGNNAIIIRVPSHVIILRNGCHRQRRRHLHARLLVSDPENLLHRYITCLLFAIDKLPRFVRHSCSYARNDKARCRGAVRRARPGL